MSRERGAPVPAPCERVLLVDDEPDLLTTLSELLQLEGIPDVRCARTVREAETILAAGFRPAAIVLDLLLDGERGEPFAARLAADPALRAAPVLALSGDHDALRRLGPAFARGLLKPADPDEVVAALAALCGGRRC